MAPTPDKPSCPYCTAQPCHCSASTGTVFVYHNVTVSDCSGFTANLEAIQREKRIADNKAYERKLWKERNRNGGRGRRFF